MPATFDIQFPFVIRQAIPVANAIARVAQADLRFGREILQTALSRSRSILRITAAPQPDGSRLVTVRYEGGTLVVLNLFDTSTLEQPDRFQREKWVVYGATVRYYRLDASYERVGGSKEQYTLSTEELIRLSKSSVGWNDPAVKDLKQLTSDVGVFWDDAAGSGHVEADPESDNSGHARLYERVPYCILIPGDRERAIVEARRILASCND